MNNSNNIYLRESVSTQNNHSLQSNTLIRQDFPITKSSVLLSFTYMYRPGNLIVTPYKCGHPDAQRDAVFAIPGHKLLHNFSNFFNVVELYLVLKVSSSLFLK